jgi:hypothetical protein
MKHTKHNLIFACIMLLGMFSIQLRAQLNGAYTINSLLPTGGTNFASFGVFAATINTAGVSGPVNVVVTLGGTPYVEQCEFVAIAGTSATNTITINGNANTITFGGGTTANPHTIRLNGTDYLYINNLIVEGTNGTNAMALHMYNGCEHNRFNSCTFKSPINGTGTRHYPVCMSGSSNGPTTAGNSGNDNIWNGCTMSGGIRGVNFYGNSGSPYNYGNKVQNCNIRDFYQYGTYVYYCQNTEYSDNVIERLNRTTVTTTYGMYIGFNAYPTLIERNRIRRLFDAVQGSGSTGYGIRIATSALSNSVNIIRNNLISDIQFAGQFMGIYDGGYTYNNIYHNTISLDDLNSTAFNGTWGIYTFGSSQEIKNNLISITRGGPGQKNCLYMGSSNIVCDNNILYYNPAAGIGGVGNYNGTDYLTLANWQNSGNGWDMLSKSANPQFASPGTGNYAPTVVALNNAGLPMGLAVDITNLPRNLPAPDAGAFEFFNQACSGTPTTNTILLPNGIICPSALSMLTLANTYTVNGIQFQWQAGPNQVGPFAAIPGATLASYQTPPLPNSTWYNVVLSCANGGLNYTVSAGQVQIATTLTNSVPYSEEFENASSAANLLPNCSWSRSSLPNCKTSTVTSGTARSPLNGSGFAYFDYAGQYTQNTYRFHSNGIQMYAGVTYSAWVSYITPGWSAYSEFALKYGPNQSNTGLITLASVSNPQNQGYATISNTFQVATSGIYYMAVTATDNSGGNYISFDDLNVTAPCQYTNNAANFTVNGPAAICTGQTATLTALGVGSYSWNNGNTTSSITVSPLNGTVYTVVGTNTLSNCKNTQTTSLLVNQVPAIQIFAPSSAICAGQSIVLSAFGSANSYAWDNGALTSLNVVSPLITTTYNVIGTNSYSCTNVANVVVNVNQAPQINVSGSLDICRGESGALTGLGADTYTWSSQTSFIQTNPIAPYPQLSTSYTVSGTDANGCVGNTVVYMMVNACTGITKVNQGIESLQVYPNPNNGVFTVELANGLLKTIEVVDLTGRTVLLSSGENDAIAVNINNLANGVYYVKVKSANAVAVSKMIKN